MRCLLGCDLEFKTAGITMMEYRSNIAEYTRQAEGLRADLLEEGTITDETIYMFWLLRESHCLQDLFSKKELEMIHSRINNLYQNNLVARNLLPISIHKALEFGIKEFLISKKQFARTQFGIGLNYAIPTIQRSESIFIETEGWFPSTTERLTDVINQLKNQQHEVTIMRGGSVPLLKIDNVLWEAIPAAVAAYHTAIHGVRLRRYQM